MRRVLLLGGTREGRLMAERLSGVSDIEVVLSLKAGVLSKAIKPRCDFGVRVRFGGFGGVEGLAAYLKGEGITDVIDATHPYAEQMSRHAAEASAEASAEVGVRRLALWRDAWEADAGAGDDWRLCGDWRAIWAAVPEGAVVFLAAGQEGVEALALAAERDFRLVVRAMSRPSRFSDNNVSDDVVFIQGMPGETLAEEAGLFESYGITHVVCKNSGGASSFAKLSAARVLGLPVLMLARPAPPPPPLYADAESLLADFFAGNV